ncbi:hypothetical protein NG99_13020 [Erwinia typographi]|uniref:Uncharacterized protein n=1 Tax=Erwinia typographi TaxID=371042 RepID=A0A0A3Z1W0_9GAMM|nr:hypothetical protein NG99_13020 [Erwinia typographi]
MGHVFFALIHLNQKWRGSAARLAGFPFINPTFYDCNDSKMNQKKSPDSIQAGENCSLSRVIAGTILVRAHHHGEVFEPNCF